MRILDETALKYIPERIKNANKGSYGHVLVIAGSSGMSGAIFECNGGISFRIRFG